MKKPDYFSPFFFVAATLQLTLSASANAQDDIIQKLDQDQDTHRSCGRIDHFAGPILRRRQSLGNICPAPQSE